MHTIDTSVTIAAAPSVVWEIITGFDRYHEWNPFIPNAAGQAVSGTVLMVEIRPPGGKAMTHRPTVVAAEPGRLLRWHGRLALPGLFDARHEFAVHQDGAATTLVHREEFRGLLVPLLRRTLRRTEAGFHAMNQALKARAEAQRAGGPQTTGRESTP